jgi:hypothetical protein
VFPTVASPPTGLLPSIPTAFFHPPCCREFLRNERAFNALGCLEGILVAAFAGGEDSEWLRGSPDTKVRLDALGIENTLEVVAGLATW